MRKALILIKRALLNLARRPGATLLSASTVAVVFMLLGMFLLAGTNLRRFSQGLEAGFRLSVYLRDDCGPECRQRAAAAVEKMEGVERLESIDAQQALERFRLRLGAEATVLDLLEVNPLPASIEVTPVESARTLPALSALAQQLVSLDGVEEVVYGQGWLERFFRFRDTLGLVGLVMGCLVLLAAAVIVSNTIRLSVYARREEIEILRLVGASGAFIRVPFYLEGVLLGLLGAAAGAGLLALVFWLLAPAARLPATFGQTEMALRFLEPLWLEALPAAGALLGLLGAAVSLRRHLER